MMAIFFYKVDVDVVLKFWMKSVVAVILLKLKNQLWTIEKNNNSLIMYTAVHIVQGSVIKSQD